MSDEDNGTDIDLNGGSDDDLDNNNNDDVDKDDKGNDDKLFTQADLDRLLQKRLKRQEDQLTKKYADYDTIKADADNFRKLQDEKSTDSERWEKERAKFLADLQERDEKLTKLERANLISDLATDKGLPKSFWKRVTGDTPEEIEEDIESVINDLGITKESKDTSKDSGTRKKGGRVYGGGGENEDPEPDTDSIVSKIPRGPQFRIDNSRSK